MMYQSTRGKADPVDAGQALIAGLAPDGGLYWPQDLPLFEPSEFSDCGTAAQVSARLLTPFLAGSQTAQTLGAICAASFDQPLPIVQPDRASPSLHVLELFHGPTAAFKDIGARFLLAALAAECADKPPTILVATSGDTGAAVGAAAEAQGDCPAFILYPKGRVSAVQEAQLTAWNPPVEAIRISDDFDACQRLVKQALSDPALASRHRLTSANSISIGRLLPQMGYWAHAALSLAAKGRRPGLIIPTGNLGNALAAMMARACGLPIGPIILATNANATLSDWHSTGQFRPRHSIATLANAMDVGAPSNFERLRHLPGDPVAGVIAVQDAAIRSRIKRTYQTTDYCPCPHTATGLEAYFRLSRSTRTERPWLVAATAHPAKFSNVIAPLIGTAPEAPDALKKICERPARVHDRPASLTAITDLLS
ncbi:threonine synthase [Maricaulis sp. CAU 1757]